MCGVSTDIRTRPVVSWEPRVLSRYLSHSVVSFAWLFRAIALTFTLPRVGLLRGVCARRLRGTGGDLIILEEAAFIASDVWTEVVIPLIEVKNTALIAISTPLDSSNFYSTLVSMKDDRGESVFEVLEARAACALCIETLDDPVRQPKPVYLLRLFVFLEQMPSRATRTALLEEQGEAGDRARPVPGERGGDASREPWGGDGGQRRHFSSQAYQGNV